MATNSTCLRRDTGTTFGQRCVALRKIKMVCISSVIAINLGPLLKNISMLNTVHELGRIGVMNSNFFPDNKRAAKF